MATLQTFFLCSSHDLVVLQHRLSDHSCAVLSLRPQMRNSSRTCNKTRTLEKAKYPLHGFRQYKPASRSLNIPFNFLLFLSHTN